MCLKKQHQEIQDRLVIRVRQCFKFSATKIITFNYKLCFFALSIERERPTTAHTLWISSLSDDFFFVLTPSWGLIQFFLTSQLMRWFKGGTNSAVSSFHLTHSPASQTQSPLYMYTTTLKPFFPFGMREAHRDRKSAFSYLNGDELNVREAHRVCPAPTDQHQASQARENENVGNVN